VKAKRILYFNFTSSSMKSNVIRLSIVASIPACHAGDRGSIPRDGASFLLLVPPIVEVFRFTVTVNAVTVNKRTVFVCEPASAFHSKSAGASKVSYLTMNY
jgi:hypothetical protein